MEREESTPRREQVG